jgi:cell division protein ZapD
MKMRLTVPLMMQGRFSYMSKNSVTFQLATHFLSRIALRLEFLFKTINQACDESHEIVHRYALKNIIELIDIIEKPELKSRFVKELIRMEHVLKKQRTLVNAQHFEHLVTQIHLLNHLPGLLNNLIHEDQFLKTIRQIHHSNSKECEFNSPYLVMWLNLDPLVRQHTIKNWLDCLKDIELTVYIYLSILKETSQFITVTAEHGFYQHAFSSKTVSHLILLKIDSSLGIIPKLQLGAHNVTIRLYDLDSAKEINDTTLDMDIAFCQI